MGNLNNQENNNGTISVSIGGSVLGQVAVGGQVQQNGSGNGSVADTSASGQGGDRMPALEGPAGEAERLGQVGLLAILRNLFNESELRDLFFELQVDYEAVGGRSPHDKARELIGYLARRDRIEALIAAVTAKRPEAFQTSGP